MWPFKRTQWEKLGYTWTCEGVERQVASLEPKYVFLRDRDYRAIPHQEFEKILFDCWFPKDCKTYKPEIWDCDNFAVACMAKVQERWAKISKGEEALAFGYIEAHVEGVGWHAFIWHMADNGHIAFYEPQTGKRVEYKLLSIRIMEA